MNIFGDPVNVTESDVIKTQGGRLVGFYVNKAGGALTLRDGRDDGRLLASMTPAAGWHWFPGALAKGLHASIVGDLDVTFFVN